MALLTVTSGSGDGQVHIDNGGSWVTVRDGATGVADNGSPGSNVYASQLTSRAVGRIFLPFDTSLIPSNATIISATLTLEVQTVYSSNGTIHVVAASQASTSTLVGDDYNNITFTSGGSIAISTTGQKVITLNATGLANITKGGFTKIALIEDHDLTNTDPVTTDHRFAVYMSENGSTIPTLDITYTPAAGFLFFT